MRDPRRVTRTLSQGLHLAYETETPSNINCTQPYPQHLRYDPQSHPQPAVPAPPLPAPPVSQKAIKELVGMEATKWAVQQLMARIDSNGDGEIGVDEWLAFMPATELEKSVKSVCREDRTSIMPAQ